MNESKLRTTLQEKHEELGNYVRYNYFNICQHFNLGIKQWNKINEIPETK